MHVKTCEPPDSKMFPLGFSEGRKEVWDGQCMEQELLITCCAGGRQGVICRYQTQALAIQLAKSFLIVACGFIFWLSYQNFDMENRVASTTLRLCLTSHV